MIACLLWYELAETRPAQDQLWLVIRRGLQRLGVRDAPLHLTRGIRVASALANEGLLLGQCCGYDLVYGFSGVVRLVATPRYSGPGCQGSDYRSLVLVRDDCEAGDLSGLRNSICVVNGFNSHSGTNALRGVVAPLSRDGRFFREVKVSGAHIDSLAALKSGHADVMAMDCVLHALLARHRPQALAGTRILCWTDSAPAPPFVTSATVGNQLLGYIRQALSEAFSDDEAHEAKADLLIEGVEVLPPAAYQRMLDAEAAALGHGYREMHATGVS